MDAMRNESANATEPAEDGAQPDTPAPQEQPEPAAVTAAEPEADADADPAADATDPPDAPDAPASTASPATPATPTTPVDVPQQRTAEPEAAPGKGKKRKSAPKTKSAGLKSLVVLRDGKVHYADDSIVVLDLDDAAHPDTDVHDVVDKLSELRDAAESPGRTEAVALVAELIQAKALA